ncbi:hypothetical protein [Cellulomonas sp. ICMP 17802]|uniref:hypothetical protein n=1 Tax=Cellulomonas sp. ICMP 17802 TaxID=3239199 RepID=UPI00351BE42E
MIARALADHPDVAARLRAGEEAYRAGIVRYFHALDRATFATGAYADLRGDYGRLARLIDQRAQVASG